MKTPKGSAREVIEVNRKIVVLAVALLAAAMLATPLVSATPNTKLDMFQDVAPGGTTSDADMIPVLGTEDINFGFVNFNQIGPGNLRITVVLKNAETNKLYYIYLVSGATHATVAGFFIVGTFMTDEFGDGAATVIVSISTLQSATGFGSGTYVCHLDVLGEGYPATAGGYVVSPIEITVPVP